MGGPSVDRARVISRPSARPTRPGVVPEPFCGSVRFLPSKRAPRRVSSLDTATTAFCFVVGHGAHATPTNFVVSVAPHMLNSLRWAHASIPIAGKEPRRSIMLFIGGVPKIGAPRQGRTGAREPRSRAIVHRFCALHLPKNPKTPSCASWNGANHRTQGHSCTPSRSRLRPWRRP